MVAQLVKQDDGSYDYVEVDTAKKSVAPDLTEFEAYEGVKKGGEDLVSTPSITEQTEKIQREIPSQVEFDEKTGTFITKKAKTIDLEYKAPERTAESTEETALQKVMNIQSMAGTGDAGLEKDYASMERLQKLAEQKTRAETLLSYAQTAKAGVDMYNIATGRDVLMKKILTPIKFKGSSLTSMGTGMINPYTIAGAALLTKPGRKVAKKVVKTATKVAKSAWDTVSDAVGTVICTELYKQKLMSKEDCRLSWNFTINNFSSTHINGYWYWAVPMTKIMKKHKLITKLWNHIMSNRTKDIKWRLNKGKFNLLGRLYSILIENGSYIIGKLIKKKKTKEVLV